MTEEWRGFRRHGGPCTCWPSPLGSCSYLLISLWLNWDSFVEARLLVPKGISSSKPGSWAWQLSFLSKGGGQHMRGENWPCKGILKEWHICLWSINTNSHGDMALWREALTLATFIFCQETLDLVPEGLEFQIPYTFFFNTLPRI